MYVSMRVLTHPESVCVCVFTYACIWARMYAVRETVYILYINTEVQQAGFHIKETVSRHFYFEIQISTRWMAWVHWYNFIIIPSFHTERNACMFLVCSAAPPPPSLTLLFCLSWIICEEIHSFIHSSMALQPFVGPRPLLQFRNLFYTDGRTPCTSDQPIERPLPTHRATQTQI
jgi:hypothetical protein